VPKKSVIEQVSPEFPRLLDIPRAAAYLSTTPCCIRHLVWDHKIPHVRLGKKILFDRADLDRYVEKLKEEAA
jgi:excisionase family DNA binding protein